MPAPLFDGARAFNLLQRALSDLEIAKRHLRDGVAYRPGLRVLDVGCGTGLYAGDYGDADYVGIDVATSYLAAARRAHPGKTFVSCAAADVAGLGLTFDRVFVLGVLHHLSDDAVCETIQAMLEVLRPGGRVFVLEAVWPQSRLDVAGYLLRRLDRGRYVRSRQQWLRLLGRFGAWDDEFFYNRRLPCLEMSLRSRAPAGTK